MSILRIGGQLARVGGQLARAGAPTSLLTDGQPYTIAGVGFGTRGDYGEGREYLCRATYDFNDGISPPAPWVLDSNHLANWSLVGDGRIAGRSSARLAHVNDGNCGLQVEGVYGSAQVPTSMYARFWFKPTGTGTFQGGKFFRLHNGRTGLSEYRGDYRYNGSEPRPMIHVFEVAA